jgi:hypothetical protein
MLLIFIFEQYRRQVLSPVTGAARRRVLAALGAVVRRGLEIDETGCSTLDNTVVLSC